MRQQLIDYLGTRFSDGTCSLSSKRISSSMRRQLIDYLGTRFSDGTSSLSFKRISSSMRWQLIDYLGTQFSGWDKFPISKKNLHLPRQNYHLQKHRIIDYYNTWTISPFPTKELLVHKTTSKSTTMVLKEMIHDSQRQASWKRQLANQPSNKRKKYYTSEC